MNQPIPKTQQITVDTLRRSFIFDRETGLLTWRVRPSPSCAVGDAAGKANKEGYLKITLNRTTLLAHRVVWAMHYGAWPSGILDHINGARDDNRIENLRECSYSQSNANRCMPSSNGHGAKGVTPLPHGKWQAQICSQGKNRYLGSFLNKEDAVRAYTAASEKEFGAFARTSEVTS